MRRPLLWIHAVVLMLAPLLPPCAHASDWVPVDNARMVEFDNRILRSDAHRIETWVRFSYYGGRREIPELGLRAGSVKMASVFNCADGTVVTRLARYYEEPAGVGREIGCQQTPPGSRLLPARPFPCSRSTPPRRCKWSPGACVEIRV